MSPVGVPPQTTCSWCKNPPVKAITRMIGKAPTDPKLVGTEKDPRRGNVVRACEDHKHLIEWNI